MTNSGTTATLVHECALVVLDGLAHFALELVEVPEFAHCGTFAWRGSLAERGGFVVKEKSLVDLAEMAADIAFHFVGFDTRTIFCQNSITQLVTPIRIAEFVLNLGQNQQECQI